MITNCKTIVSIRRYKHGAWLATHTDRLSTHVISAIVHLGHKVLMMMIGWWFDDDLMMIWWRLDGDLMVIWRWFDVDLMMISCWCNDDSMMMTSFWEVPRFVQRSSFSIYYQTQVSLACDLWVLVSSVTHTPFADLADVTLADKDSNSIPTIWCQYGNPRQCVI